MQAKFVHHPAGRVLLHLICLLRDGHVRWHLAGVCRELRGFRD